SFDLVTCRVAPHHFSSPASFIQGVSRVLKPKGFLVLIDGTVPDDHEEAEAWLHDIEKLRDPSHHRLLTPRAWSTLCETHGLLIQQLHLERRQQPDLQWYFETANTPPANRQEVLKRIETAPRSARELFEIDEAEGKITWWWSMLTLVAQAE
ncbi:MAG: class I SAM-dependent methyltransferase, partial [Planctomycetota bacterium]